MPHYVLREFKVTDARVSQHNYLSTYTTTSNNNNNNNNSNWHS